MATPRSSCLRVLLDAVVPLDPAEGLGLPDALDLLDCLDVLESVVGALEDLYGLAALLVRHASKAPEHRVAEWRQHRRAHQAMPTRATRTAGRIERRVITMCGRLPTGLQTPAQAESSGRQNEVRRLHQAGVVRRGQIWSASGQRLA